MPPQISDDPQYQLLRQEKTSEFNAQKESADCSQLSGADFRSLDLRGLDANGLDFTDSYFRGADLRGIDFRNSQLVGASIAEAKISGCYFPKELSAEEIRLSRETGMRMRYR